jgi:hypothetical protein
MNISSPIGRVTAFSSVHANSLEMIADMLARFIVASGPAYRQLPAVMERRVQYILQQQHFNK